MLSQTSEYALRAIVCLAEKPGQQLTAQEIATATAVPADYLAKVLLALARAGIVRSQRGRNGGFTLAGRPEDLNVLQVVDAIDPLKRIERCPLGREEHLHALCPLHRRLDEAVERTQEAFRGCSIADVVDPTALANGCAFPVAGER